MYYSFANTFTELANEQGYDFTCKVRTTAGSNANIRLLSDGYIEIGLAQAALIADAYKTNEDLRAIAGLYTENLSASYALIQTYRLLTTCQDTL